MGQGSLVWSSLELRLCLVLCQQNLIAFCTQQVCFYFCLVQWHLEDCSFSFMFGWCSILHSSVLYITSASPSGWGFEWYTIGRVCAHLASFYCCKTNKLTPAGAHVSNVSAAKSNIKPQTKHKWMRSQWLLEGLKMWLYTHVSSGMWSATQKNWSTTKKRMFEASCTQEVITVKHCKHQWPRWICQSSVLSLSLSIKSN